MSDGLTRRTLLRRGGVGAAGAGVFGLAALPAGAKAQADEGQSRNAVLVVLPLVRADHVNAFEGDSPADTPNLDDLAGDSLRFDRVIPESMPGLPARRALITGMRSYPFRDWKRTEGLAPVPGFNPIWDWQPVITETLRDNGVATAYVSDNPILEGERFPDVVRAGGSAGGSLRPARHRLRADPVHQAPDAGRGPHLPHRHPRARPPAGRRALLPRHRPLRPGRRRLRSTGLRQARRGRGRGHRPDGRPPRGAALERGRGEEGPLTPTRTHVEKVDDWVGRLMDRMSELDLLGSTMLVAIGDQGIALGDHSYLGIATPTSHRPAYEVPMLIRHPDGEKAGDNIDWYATTHDVAPTIVSFMGVTIPGKMGGEDLNALFDDVDQWDLYHRGYNLTAAGSNIIVRDDRWLMVADREEIERRLYDDDEEAEDDITRFEDVANEDPNKLTELSQVAVMVAGGTLPEFGPDGALRPNRERGDDDSDDDSIPNDFDPIDNDEPEDGTETEDFEFDGRVPEGGRLPSNERTPESRAP